MPQIIKYCKKCFEDPYKYAKNICDIIDFLDIQDVIENDSIGYFCINEDNECDFCRYHPSEKLIKSNLTSEEFHAIEKISSNLQFIRAMEELKQSDPIEFQLKMSQFKVSASTQEQIKKQSDNRPKCPTCNSTNIEKISVGKKAVGGFMFGLLSSDVRKTMHCKNCGYKW